MAHTVTYSTTVEIEVALEVEVVQIEEESNEAGEITVSFETKADPVDLLSAAFAELYMKLRDNYDFSRDDALAIMGEVDFS